MRVKFNLVMKPEAVRTDIAVPRGCVASPQDTSRIFSNAASTDFLGFSETQRGTNEGFGTRQSRMRRRDLIERGRIQARGGPSAATNLAVHAPAPPPAAAPAPHSAKRRKTPAAAKKNASFGSPGEVRSPLAAINLNDSRFKGPTVGRAGGGSPRVRSNLSKSSFGSPVVIAPPSAGRARAIAPAPSLMRDLGLQSPRTVDMMDAEMSYDDDVNFGAQESFGDWLARCGLRGPADASAHGSLRISQSQRDELEHVWCNAAEADTLRRLVENLKDSELDIARREQLANGAWAHDFEEATAKAWSGKVKAASAAEMAAKAELDRKAREAEAAAAVAAAERCRVAAAAVESGELRGELREAMMAAEGQRRRAERLEADVRDAAAESADLASQLADARRALTDAEQRASAANARVLEAEAAARAERAAYDSSVTAVTASMESERVAAAARLESAVKDADEARAETAQLRREMSARLEAMGKDGEDGKAALRAAIAVREKEVEHSRRSAGEAQRISRQAELRVSELEGQIGELRRVAEARVAELERELGTTAAALDEARRGRADAEEASSTLRRRAERALAEANAKAVEAQVKLRRAELDAQARARETMAVPPAMTPRSAGDLEMLLANMTKAHAQALQRAEAAEGKSRSLHRELEHTKAAAEEAGKRVASAIDAMRAQGLEASILHQASNDDVPAPSGGSRRKSVLTLAPTMQRLHSDLAKVKKEKDDLEREVATLRAARAPLPASPVRGVVAGDDHLASRRAEVDRLDAAIADRSRQLRKMEAAAATMKFAFGDNTEAPTMSVVSVSQLQPAHQQRRASDGGCSGLPGRSLPTPRTRARTSIRIAHGCPSDESGRDTQDAPREPSPGAELRRRAIAMGMRASPFAKRKRAP